MLTCHSTCVVHVRTPLGTQTPLPETFSYDLVDVGREVLSQLAIPAASNFSNAIGLGGAPRDTPGGGRSRTVSARAIVSPAAHVNATGELYVVTLGSSVVCVEWDAVTE